MDLRLREIVQAIDVYLRMHPNVSLQLLAERIAIPSVQIEEALANVEGISFEEFREEKRLERAFERLGELSPAANGPYDIVRARRRLAIPRATVRYGIPVFYRNRVEYSHSCPLVDLSRDGLALLADRAESPRRRISMLLRFPGEDPAVRVDGRIIYAVATGIAGYRYRIGIRFLPFTAGGGGNDLRVLDVLDALERKFGSRE